MRRLFAVTAIIIITPLIFGVSASIFSGETDTIAQDVSLKPADGPNGDYAYLDRNDELVIDISETNQRVSAEGVPAGEVTTLDDVFVAGYNGSQYAEIWITEDSPAVTFSARGRQIQSQSNAVRLNPNETVSVKLQVDTVGRTSVNIDDITVHARVAEPSDVSDTSTQDADRTDASIEDEDDSGDVSIQTQSPTTESREITIQDAGGESVTVEPDSLIVNEDQDASVAFESISASVETNQATMTIEDVPTPKTTQGNQNVKSVGAVDITESGSGIISQASLRFSVPESYLETTGATADELVILHETESGWTQLETEVIETRNKRTIIEADTRSFSMFVVAVETPEITITDVTTSPSPREQGETNQVIVDVQNNGAADGSTTLKLRDSEDQIAAQSVTLNPGSSATLQFNLTSNTAGSSTFTIERVKNTTVVLNATTAKAAQITESNSPTTVESPSSALGDSQSAVRSTDNEESNAASTETTNNQSASGAVGLGDMIGGVAGVTLVAVIIITAMWHRRRRYR
jgi:PGF-pre-PGF domain-containing protein